MSEWKWDRITGSSGNILLWGRKGALGVTVEMLAVGGGCLFGGGVITDGGRDVVECASGQWGLGLEQDAQAKAEAIAERDAEAWLAHTRNEGARIDGAEAQEEGLNE